MSLQDNEGNLGGAIFNDGKVTMFESAIFFDNACAVREDAIALWSFLFQHEDRY